MNKKTLEKANKLTSQISDITTILYLKKIRALSLYKDTAEEEKQAKKDGKTYFDLNCSTNVWDSDIQNELLKAMQKYAEGKFKEIKKQLAEL